MALDLQSLKSKSAGGFKIKMNNSRIRLWIYDVLFLLTLLVAGYFRFSGLNWDQNQHLHPDERFMTMVESAIAPVQSLSDYFNTDTSTLNPHNRGFNFYVYGDLPIVIVRYAAETMSSITTWAAQNVQANGADGLFGPLMNALGKTPNWTGYDEVALVGRFFSALSDMGTLVLLYLIASQLYGRKVATLATAFSSLAVMQIQQSHFFTVDMFANFFMFLAIYFAVQIMVSEGPREAAPPASIAGKEPGGIGAAISAILSVIIRDPLFWNVIGFGLAFGASVASKINAAPLAVLLPGALAIMYFRKHKNHADQPTVVLDEASEIEEHPSGTKYWAMSMETMIALLVLGGFISILAFRVFMPYAFSGPGFFGITPNPKWVANITEQRAQASGDVDFPPALQWARRSFLFSGYNMEAWGLGWPLGILAALGFIYMGWRILRGEWKEYLLLWGWTGAYFIWQSTQSNPNMRYQLPIYPLLALMAAWITVQGLDANSKNKDSQSQEPPPLDSAGSSTADSAGSSTADSAGSSTARATAKRLGLLWVKLSPWLAGTVGLGVLIATFAWAYGFTRIYARDHSRVQATHWIYQNIPGPYNLKIQQPDGTSITQPMSIPTGYTLTPELPYDVRFTAFASGDLTEIFISHAVNVGDPASQSLTINVYTDVGPSPENLLTDGKLISDFAIKSDRRGEAYTLKLNKPTALEKGRNYLLRIVTTGPLALIGSAPIQETSWDDGLPLRMDGFDAFGGIFQGDLNFEMYWDDNADKLTRFETNLDAGDYIFISSNRQWATTTRVPERYPLTSAYYRNLIGCPAEKDIIWCYNEATPGMFKGKLGFDLIQTFTSYPEVFGHQFNTQYAEESFTVYDAPKVLLFKKTAAYNSQNIRNLLGAVDLSHVVHITPGQAARYPGDLMLPIDRLNVDRAGGTWSELFSYESIQNKYPVVGLLIWYLAIGLLGLFTWPLLRFALPGLSDKGYPLARLTGLLLMAYIVWLIASLGGQYSRATIAAVYLLIVALGSVAFYLKRDEIRQEIRTKGKYYLIVEGLFLALFLIDLTIRLGNPDLWHPARGGERPMDFSYLNAVLKSTSFPPYDPWYAGGYINYYYWGFVLVGTPIKLLGIVPSIAYNFVLPTLFAMLGIGGFSVAWNLMEGFTAKNNPGISAFTFQLIAGISAAVALVLIGNLGTIQLIYHALQKLVVTNEMVDATNGSIFQHMGWALEGIGRLIQGASLSIGWGEYYWAPSRVMPTGDLAITEFPLFTFLYSDLHAHMIALPLTLLGIAWTTSTLLARKLSIWSWLVTLCFGGLVIGVLRPTNTWDFPTYLAFGSIVTGYAIFRYADVGTEKRFGLAPIIQRVFFALAGMGLLVGFALVLYQPFAQWYGLAYSEISQWTNEKTPIWSYWTHWGLFLFVITAWMSWETRQWLAQTPISALVKLKRFELLIEITLAAALVILLTLQFFLDVPVAWFAFPIAVWALVLILRPGQPDVKRLVLFMIGTGIVLTLIVEFIVLSGDIGRMNTVFKFYLQVWVLFAISAAASLGWILTEFDEWGRLGKIIFPVLGGALLSGALLFTFTASMDKIRDRMAADIPFTFDTITYMQYSHFSDQTDMDLSQDYRAIRWMQDNVKGSPVIVEANTVEYRWGTRFTIYTGLPGVAGWSWHQRQQRALFPGDWVTSRIQEITDFYNTGNSEAAKAFLAKYDVKYIVVGQQERGMYTPEGVAKFERGSSSLWQRVYSDADTAIYQVLP